MYNRHEQKVDVKRIIRLVAISLCVVFLVTLASSSCNCSEDDEIIDISNSKYGYFSVCYSSPGTARLKIGVTVNNSAEYYDYVRGETFIAAFEKGTSEYTISLYENIGGTAYRRIASKWIDVELENSFSPYLISTTEISFSEEDEVCTTADSICKDLSDTGDIVRALYKFVRSNVKYDYKLASDITDGVIKIHRPDPVSVLSSGKGVCYDFAVLFAAMCRSQDIPCFIEKGYFGSTYHAWNRVYINEKWYGVDLTIPINNYFLNTKS